MCGERNLRSHCGLDPRLLLDYVAHRGDAGADEATAVTDRRRRPSAATVVLVGGVVLAAATMLPFLNVTTSTGSTGLRGVTEFGSGATLLGVAIMMIATSLPMYVARSRIGLRALGGLALLLGMLGAVVLWRQATNLPDVVVVDDRGGLVLTWGMSPAEVVADVGGQLAQSSAGAGLFLAAAGVLIELAGGVMRLRGPRAGPAATVTPSATPAPPPATD